MAAEERLANEPRSELWGEHRARYRFALAFGLRGHRVLDLACGAGFGLQMLLDAGIAALGAELDPTALREARRVAPGVPLVRADGARIPLARAALDTVVSFETIEHVPDPMALVDEFARVLKPSGRLILSTPNRSFGPAALHRNPFHLQEFTDEELRGLLAPRFDRVDLFGQVVSSAYRYVPFLMVQRDLSPPAVAWKLANRLPFPVREALARITSGRGFYPGEDDYRFDPAASPTARTLLAVAGGPRGA